MAGFKLEDLMPMMPNEGPPLPKVFGIYWPWYKPSQIQLKAGWNEVKYTGTSQKVEVAFKSIENYLVLVYYQSSLYEGYLQLMSGSWVEPGMLLNINVSKDCTWTF